VSRLPWYILLIAFLLVRQCGVVKEALQPKAPDMEGIAGLIQQCEEGDTIESLLISKAEAILTLDNERYEVSITLYSKRDSIIYLSAVHGGFEILRATVKHDSIKVINRLNKIVYRSSLKRKFGYQYPLDFVDLQNLITNYYLCDELDRAHDDMQKRLVFDMDELHIKKRISLNREGGALDLFEFYHRKTGQYLLGERLEDSFKIYSNLMITEFEIIARGGLYTFNRDIKVKMEVNPRKYAFTELR